MCARAGVLRFVLISRVDFGTKTTCMDQPERMAAVFRQRMAPPPGGRFTGRRAGSCSRRPSQISVVGQNLFDAHHPGQDFAFSGSDLGTEVQGSVFGKVTWLF